MNFTSPSGGDHRPAFEQFFAVRKFEPTLAFTPDLCSVLFSANISGQLNLWRLPVAGGWPDQLTSFEDRSVRSVGVAPDGTIGFSADRDGDENYQLYAIDAAGGWPVAWTDAAQVQHYLAEGAGWDPSGRWLAFAANLREPADMEVWLREVATGEVRQVFGEGRFVVPVSFSPDGGALLCREMLSEDGQRLHLVDLVTGTARALTSQDEQAKYVPGPWAGDGSGVWVATDRGREYSGLAFVDLASGELQWAETPESDVTEVAGDRAGTVLVWLVNEGGWGRLHGRDLRTGRPLPAADLPAGCGGHHGTALTVSGDGRYAALLWSQPRRSQELYLVELATGRSRPLTDSMLGGLAPDRLVAPSLIRYRSADELSVPAWVYRPDLSGRLPVALAIHGGPESQERPEYTGLYQYLCSRGIAVLAPNIRGSTGYGKSYQRRIHHDWGGGDLADLRHAVEWLRAQDWVDPDRIGVFGGSYGGFAALSCVARLPGYWAAAVGICTAGNLLSWAKAVPPTWRRFMAREVGDPETEADFLLERSPITYVDQITTPLLLIQGGQDPRAPKSEADRLVERLHALGRKVEYEVFEDEGHGFTRRANAIRAMRLTADWLTHHLGGGSG